MITICLLFLVGLVIGTTVPLTLSLVATRYLSIALLVCLDAILGGTRAYLERHFDERVFFSGFFVNAAAAALLVYLGDKLGVDLYLAAIVAFGVRLFQNLTVIRRMFIDMRISKT